MTLGTYNQVAVAQVPSVAGVIMLCSWKRHFTVTVPPSA